MREVLSVFKPSEEEEQVVRNILVQKITLNPYQPRKVFDRLALEELSLSIKEYGVIQPVTVRKTRSGNYELISGERRLRASILAGKITIPAIVMTADENDSAIIALMENLQRADLTFWEEAQGYSHLVNEHGLTQEQLAKKIGKSQSAIANKLRILRLPPIVKKIIGDNALTERHARALLRLPDEQFQLKVLNIVTSRKLNVSQTEELIEKALLKLRGEGVKQRGEDKMKGIVQLRVFMNTMNKAIDMVKKSGVKILTEKFDKEGYVEYIIKIPKKNALRT